MHPRVLEKKKIGIEGKNQRGERPGQAQPVHAHHRTVLRPPGRAAWEAAGCSVTRAGGGKRLQAAPALPRNGFLWTFLVKSAAPSRVVFLPLW